MKIFRRFFIPACGAAAVLAAAPLLAQQPAPAAATAPPEGNKMVTLPAGWKVISRSDDTPAPQNPAATVNTDPHAVTLLLAASLTDAKHTITASLYSTRFHESGPTLAAGEAGIESESAGLMQAVVMQGYAPTSVEVERSATAGNRPLITLIVMAKNGAGDERIFTDSSLVDTAPAGNSYHLYTSRTMGDAEAEVEVTSIIKSLNTPGASPAIAQNQAPNAPAAPPGAGTASSNPAAAAPQTPGSPQTPQSAPTPGLNNISTLAPSAAISPKAAQIVQDYHAALVMVEGNKGVGSGFLCKMDKHTYIITNAHVLADNYGVKLTGLDGASYTAGASAVAMGHDIVKLEVPAVPKAFEVMTALDSTAKIGDAVMIPGNAEGAQVVRPVEGKIVGIGPNLIEVDAPFVKGNSGSPIIHLATGKVLGVATYLMQKKVNEGGAPGAGKIVIETRRFGYRIDSVKQWQTIDWRIFYAESKQVSDIEDLSDDFISLFHDMENGDLSPEHFKSPTMVRAVRSFLQSKATLSSTASDQDREGVIRQFFGDLRAAAHGDITVFTSRPAYDYFRRDVDDQAQFRDELYDAFTRLMQNSQFH